MNKKLLNYLEKHGSEKICNKHLMFVNELLNKKIGEYGFLYKLSNKLYMSIKNKEDKNLTEVFNLIKK